MDARFRAGDAAFGRGDVEISVLDTAAGERVSCRAGAPQVVSVTHLDTMAGDGEGEVPIEVVGVGGNIPRCLSLSLSLSLDALA
jgi:hypothetical protein